MFGSILLDFIPVVNSEYGAYLTSPSSIEECILFVSSWESNRRKIRTTWNHLHSHSVLKVGLNSPTNARYKFLIGPPSSQALIRADHKSTDEIFIAQNYDDHKYLSNILTDLQKSKPKLSQLVNMLVTCNCS